MMADKGKTLTIRFDPEIKEALEQMSEKTGISQQSLITLALRIMTYRYEQEGMKVFAELLECKSIIENKR
jgi:predicted transcriptional regulator